MKQFWSKVPKWVKITVPIVVVLFVVAFLAVGWFFSGKVITVKWQKVEYDQTVRAVGGDMYTITGSAFDVDGIMGGIRRDGSTIGIYSAPLRKDAAIKASTRQLPKLSGNEPAVGEKISLQGNIWTTDPRVALGIDYQNITYDSPLGPMGAWLIPAKSAKGANAAKWTIAVHGIGAPKREMLRFIKPVQAAGNTMMVINYRNDQDSPKSPDGYYHLGGSEWQDLQAAVRYARSHGATDIRLYADSLGGSIAENYLRRSPDVATAHISRVILDSPALDWNEVLRFQAHKAGYPSFVFYPATVVAKLRAGINFSRISTKPSDIKLPTLLIHNADDATVPQAASKRLATARPDLVTLVDFDTGGHVRAWNHDPARYEQIVTDFLSN